MSLGVLNDECPTYFLAASFSRHFCANHQIGQTKKPLAGLIVTYNKCLLKADNP